ncbi:MAG: hybrid sensor histidine kinase/response regulator [Gammaproteobacteria bacterium]
MITDPELKKLFKAESEEHLAKLDAGLLRLEKTPTDQELLEEIFRESHSLKGASRMLGLNRIESTAHGLESIFNAARKGEAPLTPDTIEQMNAKLADLRQRVRDALGDESHPQQASTGTEPPKPLASLPEDPSATSPVEEVADQRVCTAQSKTTAAVTTTIAEEHFQIETVRVETRKLDELLTQVGELSVIQGQVQHRLMLMEELLEEWTILDRTRRIATEGIAVDRQKETDCMARLGQLLKRARDAFYDDTARLESTVHLLEDQVGSLRLMPLSTLFSLFPRMVRDLAKDQNKSVELIVTGGDITVDKRILEEMKDPLMHLLRNAIDHGIESAEERTQLGKPRTATLRMSARKEEAGVLLEISDDGRGLNPQTIRQQARHRGLLDEALLSEMTEQQLQQLIFTSGFSTSAAVTELSGRGVGLDVVRVNVEHLKGSINLDSVVGRGLTIQLRLPFSLATTRLLLTRISERYYGIPVEYIRTSCRVHSEDIFLLEGHAAILLDGEPVIVSALADLLEIAETAGESDVMACVILRLDHDHLGLLVDDLPGEEEVVLKPMCAPLKRVRNLSALAMLGNGAICPVLNPADLYQSAKKKFAFNVRSYEKPKTNRNSKRPAILLAEDSALIRAMEKRILEDANYEVVTAVDGLDALNLINSRPFAALVSDVVMPNMDGLTLTARIRAIPRYQALPVILVTSLASDEDKKRGLDAGASAYIPKPTFDQRTLIQTLERLVAL